MKKKGHLAKLKDERKFFSYRTIFYIFLVLILVIGIQTALTINREREHMIDAKISEKVALAELTATSVGAAEVYVPVYKINIVNKVSEPEDIIYCRIVKPNGQIYISSIEQERGKFIKDPAITTSETVVKDDVYNGESIKVVITPSSRGYTIWVGFSLESVKSAVWAMIRDSMVIAGSVIAMVFLVYFGLTSINREVSRANKELRDTQEQLIQTEKLAALGRLSADVAHEINNPLGGIKNCLYLLSDSVSKNKKNYLEIAEREVDRIASIVRRLLDLYRPQKEIMTLTNVNVPLDEILTVTKNQIANRNVKIIKDFDTKLPDVMASSEHLKQVFLNIILNAVESMPEGGELAIRTYPHPTGEPEIKIEFADTGCGITEEEIDNIFDPFFTTKKGGKGTGLGLSVSYGVIQRHDGRIEVKSEVGKGTTFIVSLPIQEKEGENEREGEEENTHS